MPKKLDRRVIRTRRLLRDALLELIIERGYDNLTITEITERADLRRATFYLHYKDKEELLLSALTEIFDDLVNELEPIHSADYLGGKTDVAAVEAVFRYVDQNAELYRAILGGQGTVVIVRRIREYLAGLVLKGLQSLPPQSLPLPPAVMAHYIAGAELAMIGWWLEQDRPYSAVQMAEMVHRMMMQGIMQCVPDMVVLAAGKDH